MTIGFQALSFPLSMLFEVANAGAYSGKTTYSWGFVLPGFQLDFHAHVRQWNNEITCLFLFIQVAVNPDGQVIKLRHIG